jgi:hypothetical protein
VADTPFGHGVLYDLVGYSGISSAAQQAIVEGNFWTHVIFRTYYQRPDK